MRRLAQLTGFLIGLTSATIAAKTEPYTLEWALTLIGFGCVLCLTDLAFATWEDLIEKRRRQPGEWLPEEQGEVQVRCHSCKGRMVIKVARRNNQDVMTTCPSCAGIGWVKRR